MGERAEINSTETLTCCCPPNTDAKQRNSWPTPSPAAQAPVTQLLPCAPAQSGALCPPLPQPPLPGPGSGPIPDTNTPVNGNTVRLRLESSASREGAPDIPHAWSQEGSAYPVSWTTKPEKDVSQPSPQCYLILLPSSLSFSFTFQLSCNLFSRQFLFFSILPKLLVPPHLVACFFSPSSPTFFSASSQIPRFGLRVCRSTSFFCSPRYI